MTPFDELAPRYAALWSESPQGLEQRRQVWKEITGLFHAGDHILDLGCGIGDDALHLSALRVRVLGLDASAEMVQQARVRGVDAQVCRIESLEGFPGQFDGVLSNFGAFNCVADVAAAVQDLARIVKPLGYIAICVLGRFCWRESIRFLVKGDLWKAFRRLRRTSQWRGISITYRSRREWRSVFAPHFEWVRGASIGAGDHQLLIFRRVA